RGEPMRCSRAATPTKGRRSAPDGKDALDLTRLPQPAPRPRADLNACDCVRRQVRAEREPDRAASLWASRSDAAIARRARRREAPKRLTPRAMQLNMIPLLGASQPQEGVACRTGFRARSVGSVASSLGAA